MRVATVILAAGQGTRMKSSLPKVLHPLGGRSMVEHVVEAARTLSNSPPVLVVGVGQDLIRSRLSERVRYVVQEDQLGTGHAVKQTEALLAGKADVILVCQADMPLLRAATMARLIDVQLRSESVMTLLTVVSDDPRGFGRVVRDPVGCIQAIVEEVDCALDQLSIKELNAGVYCFKADWLWANLSRIPLSPKGEYYLPALIDMAVQQGEMVETILTNKPGEVIGVNNRVHLAEAQAILRQWTNEKCMLSGVTIVDPATTYVDVDVEIGQDTIIYPNTHLLGQTHIGANCRLGPNTIIRDSVVGDRCEILASVVESAVLEEEVDVGPYGHLRKGAHLARGVHMGNFGEVKNSYLGPGTKMGHLGYLGDATIEANVNIGAGTITCNYDGVSKHPTVIRQGAFIGSDTMLVAPVEVGKGAKTGAGSVITRDVPAGQVVYGVPARARPSSNGEMQKVDSPQE